MGRTQKAMATNGRGTGQLGLGRAARQLLASRESLLLLAMAALLALVAVRFPGFVAPGKLADVFNDTAPLVILAIGQTMVILTRCIDLSVAANLALCGMIVAMLNVAAPGIPVWALLALSAGIGAVLGMANGILVWKLSIPPIVVTLGTLTIFRGAIFMISGGDWVNSHEMSPAFKALPRAELAGMPVLSWIAVAVIAVAGMFMARTAAGRALFAVGGNPDAAAYTGLNVGRSQFLAFTACGALAGLTGYLWVARYAVAYVDIASGFELEVIAACVIGGVSIAGGVGSVGGAVLGALFLGIVKNALPVINVSPFWQLAISGTAILVAIVFNARSARDRGRVILRRREAGP